MARATHLTIGTADRIRLDAGNNENDPDYDEDGKDGIRQEVQVSVTYVLGPEDTDLAAVAEEKAGEVQRAHEAAWNRIGAFGSGTPCGCRSSRSGFEEDEEDDDEGSDGSPQQAGPPPGLPPAVPPTGAWYLPGASGLSGGDGTAGTDVEPVTGPQKILIRSRAGKVGLNSSALEGLLYQQFKVWRLDRLTKAQAASLLDVLDRDLKEKDADQQRTKEKNGTHGSPASTGAGRAA